MRRYVSSYYYMCPHTTLYVSSSYYVSSYYCICVLLLLHMSSYYYICVLILLYMCPHTTICVLILLYPVCTGQQYPLPLLDTRASQEYMSSYYYIYVSSYYYVCVLILLYQFALDNNIPFLFSTQGPLKSVGPPKPANKNQVLVAGSYGVCSSLLRY